MAEATQATRPAGLGVRLAAIAYDTILLIALWMLAAALYLPATGGTAPEPGDWVFRVYLLGVAYLFFVGFWFHGGQTLGMRAWRLRVTRPDGGRPGVGALSLRFLAAMASWAALGFGFWWSWVDGRRRTFHDCISRTQLIREAPETPGGGTG